MQLASTYDTPSTPSAVPGLQHSQGTPPDASKRSVSRRACLNCRERKIKCNGVEVCKNCKQLNLECVFVKSHRGGRRYRTKSKDAPVNSAAGEFTVTTTPAVPAASAHPIAAPAPQIAPPVAIPVMPPTMLPGFGMHHPEPPVVPPKMAAAHFTARPPPQPQPYNNTSNPYPSTQRENNTNGFATYNPADPNPSPIHETRPHNTALYLPRAADKLEFPVINDEDTRRAVISQIQTQIDDLQRQVLDLQQASRGDEFGEIPLTRWEVSKEELASVDLPSMDITSYFIDLYYKYYHPNHCFLLPKESMLRRISLKSDVGFLHAMFAISCRYSRLHQSKCHELGISEYLMDPMYWLNLFEKHRRNVYSTLLIKCLLLVGITHAMNDDAPKSLKVMKEAMQLCQWHSLDKKFRSGAHAESETGTPNPESPSKEAMLLKESHLRTVWEIWRVQVKISLILNDPDLIPPFNGDLELPVSDAIYEREFEGWDHKRYLWRDIDADLLSSVDEPGSPLRSSSRQGVSIEEREKTLYCSSAMHIVSAHLMSLVFKLHKHLTPEVIRTLEPRLRVLYSKLPAMGSDLPMGGYFMSYGCLHTATLLLHMERAQSFLVFLPTGKSAQSFNTRDKAYIDSFIKSEKDRDACNSYVICQWASHWLYKLSQGQKTNATLEFCHKIWAFFPPLSGFVLQRLIILSGTEYILQMSAKHLGLPIQIKSPSCIFEYPVFTSDSATSSSSQSFVSSASSTPSDRLLGAEVESSLPLGMFGDLEETEHRLETFVALTSFLGELWPKIRKYHHLANIVKKETELFKH